MTHHTHRYRKGSCWIPGPYTPCTGLKHLILNGFFQRCRIGRDPRGKPVKTTCYAKLDQLRPWNPIWVVYPNPADNAISAKTGKTAMTSATSSFKMAQGNALARFRRVRCSSAQ